MLVLVDRHTHDWNLARIDQSPKALNCFHTVCGIARSVRDCNGERLGPAPQIVHVPQKLTEDSVKMMSDFVDRIVEWKASNTAPAAY